MSAPDVGTNVVQLHLFLGAASLGLEEDGGVVLALGTLVLGRTGQRRVGDHVGHDLGKLVNVVHDFVDVDAVVVGVLAKVAVAARVHQSLIAQRKQDVVIDTVEITDKMSIS